jgi:hypothetical protein
MCEAPTAFARNFMLCTDKLGTDRVIESSDSVVGVAMSEGSEFESR